MSSVSIGAKITSGSGVEVIVVKAAADTAITFEVGDPIRLGKRYRCTVCQAEVMATKVGAEYPACHSTPMVMAEAKQLPSSD